LEPGVLGIREAIKHLKGGASESLLNAIFDSSSRQSVEAYARIWKRWISFNQVAGTNWDVPSLAAFADFIGEEVTQRRPTASYVQTLQTALSFVYVHSTATRAILDDPAFRRIFKAASKRCKPSTPHAMVDASTDLRPLFRLIRDLSFKEERDIRLRAILLIRMALFARNSDMANISAEHSAVRADGLHIVFFPLKQSSKQTLEVRLVKRNSEDQFLCPAFAFECYHQLRLKDTRTAQEGNQVSKFFISLRSEKLRPLSGDRIGSLTKEAFKRCGLSLRPHDLRAVCASNSLEAGMPMEAVLSSGGWRSELTFRRHYLAPKMGSDAVARVSHPSLSEDSTADTSVSSESDDA
jgi:hypothetical protein